jgi:hypothetical protein
MFDEKGLELIETFREPGGIGIHASILSLATRRVDPCPSAHYRASRAIAADRGPSGRGAVPVVTISSTVSLVLPDRPKPTSPP